ncbi:hypothetical protein, partial [Peribacillus frigoritolerans]|uniref:hypothetical protein n=1 Tax=Peribacillus frigoritolerans TaxID=450367 RepID=UPI001CEF8075
SCGKSVANGDPAGERRGGSRTARGKRVPGVEIITHTPFRKSAPFPPTGCSMDESTKGFLKRISRYIFLVGEGKI